MVAIHYSTWRQRQRGRWKTSGGKPSGGTGNSTAAVKRRRLKAAAAAAFSPSAAAHGSGFHVTRSGEKRRKKRIDELC